jgi:tRNA uridine 5-carboxymethylaminomethyl modification enzyme
MADESYDIIVVGGGHAGIEASLAASRLGASVLLLTHAAGEIGRMPCNPAIGGLGKGHLVREIDVLGGEMALAIDATGIQFRILNRRKGPAVQAPRAQADKHDYSRYMLRAISRQDRLQVVEGEAAGLIVENGSAGRKRMAGVRTADGRVLASARVVLCAGTFLRGLMHVGEQKRIGGREGAASAEGLSGDLTRLGFTLRRLKTGTPPRLRRDSIDFARLQAQPGDEEPRPFSFRTEVFAPEQVLCHLTYTNERTHHIICSNLDRSPLYGGIIKGRGPRYCPSIEDKVVRFAEKDRHLIFLEPEGRESEEIYVNGLPTSLPSDVQIELVHSIVGLEEAELVRFGYAVEYDSVPSYQVQSSLESKIIDGLYLSGQIVGTSGYEEAAAQGFMAGINAFRALNNQEPLIIGRSEGYIGVLIDDLVTKDINEPYRMFTSRAEHRLSLRCDNAESRLLHHAEELKLLPEETLRRMQEFEKAARSIKRNLRQFLATEPGGSGRLPAAEHLKRPGVDLKYIFQNFPEGEQLRAELAENGIEGASVELRERRRNDLLNRIETDIKYEGYIAKQERIESNQKYLNKLEIPFDIDYAGMTALSREAREKLTLMRPSTLGQAGRIDGVRAGDLAVLSVMVKKIRRERGHSAEARRDFAGRRQSDRQPGEDPA